MYHLYGQFLSYVIRVLSFSFHPSYFSRINGLNTRADRLRDECRDFCLTVYNFHQSEKVEWNKLVRAQIEARKYLLGQQKFRPK